MELIIGWVITGVWGTPILLPRSSTFLSTPNIAPHRLLKALLLSGALTTRTGTFCPLLFSGVEGTSSQETLSVINLYKQKALILAPLIRPSSAYEILPTIFPDASLRKTEVAAEATLKEKINKASISVVYTEKISLFLLKLEDFIYFIKN